MDADDFRDYMLSLLFLRYLPDNYETAAKKELGKDYPTLGADDRRVPLALWYANNPDDIPEFEKQMRRKVHYVIQPPHLWNSIANMARTQNGELLNTLQAGFKYIETESFESTFNGLFSEINLGSDKLGRKYEDRNAKLCSIIAEIAKGLAEFSSDIDALGDAYEKRVVCDKQGGLPFTRRAAGRVWNDEGSGLSIPGNSRQTRLIMACDSALADRVMANVQWLGKAHNKAGSM